MANMSTNCAVRDSKETARNVGIAMEQMAAILKAQAQVMAVYARSAKEVNPVRNSTSKNFVTTVSKMMA